MIDRWFYHEKGQQNAYAEECNNWYAILIFGYINVSYVACKACTVCIEYSENYKMKLFLL